MTTRLLLAAVAATASLVAACGEEKEAGNAPASQLDKNKQAMLDYARCMRENGIDMPDPTFEGGRVTMRAGGPGQKINQDDMRAAEQACAKFQEAIEPPELSEEEQAENKKAALANAKCMRENGVPKFPDPTFDENGGAQIRMQKGVIDPESPTFQKALKKCDKLMPRSSTTEAGGE